MKVWVLAFTMLWMCLGCSSVAQQQGHDAAMDANSMLDGMLEADVSDTLQHRDAADAQNVIRSPFDPENHPPLYTAATLDLSMVGTDDRAVRGFATYQEHVVDFKDGTPSTARTGAFGLRPGRYAVLIQYHADTPDRELATVDLEGYASPDDVNATTTSRLGSVGRGRSSHGDDVYQGEDGFYRSLFEFEISSTHTIPSHRIVIQHQGNEDWLMGVVAIHKIGRPFFNIAHNPDSIERLDEALAQGANALGPDLMFSPLLPTQVAVAHPALLFNTACTSDTDGRADLETYLMHLNHHAPGIAILWDIKPNAGAWIEGDCENVTQDYAGYAEAIKSIGMRANFDWSHSIASVPTLDMVEIFNHLMPLPTGTSVDGLTTLASDHPLSTWTIPAQNHQLTWSGLGISVYTLRSVGAWARPVAGLVRSRDTQDYPKKINFWTVSKAWEMRRMLDFGVDGLITDDVATLRTIVLQQEPYKTLYRYADTTDDPQERFGGNWICDQRCW